MLHLLISLNLISGPLGLHQIVNFSISQDAKFIFKIVQGLDETCYLSQILFRVVAVESMHNNA